MRKNAFNMIAALALFVAFGVGPAAAQSSITLRAQIPFDFTVRDYRLPAGEYRIQPAASGVLVIQRVDSEANVMALTTSVSSKDWQEESRLVFHCYGNSCFLAQIWKAGDNAGFELPKSKAELELARTEAPREVVLLARR